MAKVIFTIAEEDKVLLSDAAYKKRMSLSAFVRRASVLQAQAVMGGYDEKHS